MTTSHVLENQLRSTSNRQEAVEAGQPRGLQRLGHAVADELHWRHLTDPVEFDAPAAVIERGEPHNVSQMGNG